MTDGEIALLAALIRVRNAAVRALIAPSDKRQDALVDAVEEADQQLEIEAARRRLGDGRALPPSRPALPATRLAFPQVRTPPQGTPRRGEGEG